MRIDVDAAADELWAAAEAGDHAPISWAGRLTFEDGLAVQLCHLDRKLAADERQIGWKVGLTSPRARDTLGSNERPFGHLLRSAEIQSGGSVATDAMTEPHIEPELCFVFARPVDDGSKLAEAVGSIHAAFELNENRPGSSWGDFPLMVADNMAQWGIVVGAGANPRTIDLNAVGVQLRCDDEVRFEGVSGDLLDDHWESLGRLVDVLGRHSRRIEAGHRVITGAYCRLPVEAGQRWEATYGIAGADPMGSVEVSFT